MHSSHFCEWLAVFGSYGHLYDHTIEAGDHVCNNNLSCVFRWTAEALQKYTKSVRSEAPYLPSNIQYIANNNGLEDREDVSVLGVDPTVVAAMIPVVLSLPHHTKLDQYLQTPVIPMRRGNQ